MTKQTNKRKAILILTPIFGAILFVALYIIAAFLYPGGSQADKNAAGFSLVNNYWCNLLGENAINGQPNSAKPVAMTGMFVLCITLSLFWILFSKHANISKKLKLIIPVAGLLSMSTAFLLFTGLDHDSITNLASAFGLVATIGTIVGLYQVKWFKLFAFGLLNILLVVLNNYVYYSKEMIVYLPVIQKISFAVFLIWICCICIKAYRREKKHSGADITA